MGAPPCCSPLRNNFSGLQANHLARLAPGRSEGDPDAVKGKGGSERAELRLLIGIKTAPQRLADAEAHRQITGEGTSGDSFIKF